MVLSEDQRIQQLARNRARLEQLGIPALCEQIKQQARATRRMKGNGKGGGGRKRGSGKENKSPAPRPTLEPARASGESCRSHHNTAADAGVQGQR